MLEGAQGEGGTDSFGHLLKEQQKLFGERDMLTSQIQRLPGFDNFLMAAPFDTLLSTTSRGPAISINQCVLRSDMIIVLHGARLPFIPDYYCQGFLLESLRQSLPCSLFATWQS